MGTIKNNILSFIVWIDFIDIMARSYKYTVNFEHLQPIAWWLAHLTNAPEIPNQILRLSEKCET